MHHLDSDAGNRLGCTGSPPPPSAPQTGTVRLLHRGDAPGPDLGDLLVGQRPVRRAQTQRIGEAARPVGHARPPVHVEQGHRLEQLAARRRARSSPPRRRARPRPRRRPGRRRSTGTCSPGQQRRCAGAPRSRSASRSTSSHPTRRCSGIEAELLEDAGVDLAHDADRPARRSPPSPDSDETGRPGRVQPGGHRRELGTGSAPGATSSTSTIPKASASDLPGRRGAAGVVALARQCHGQDLALVDHGRPRTGQGLGHTFGLREAGRRGPPRRGARRPDDDRR